MGNSAELLARVNAFISYTSICFVVSLCAFFLEKNNQSPNRQKVMLLDSIWGIIAFFSGFFLFTEFICKIALTDFNQLTQFVNLILITLGTIFLLITAKTLIQLSEVKKDCKQRVL